jgi:hypothetical protein
MTARRLPAPVEAGRPKRTDSQFAANPMDIGAQLIFGADLVKFPGWSHALPRQAAARPGSTGARNCARNSACLLRAAARWRSFTWP